MPYRMDWWSILNIARLWHVDVRHVHDVCDLAMATSSIVALKALLAKQTYGKRLSTLSSMKTFVRALAGACYRYQTAFKIIVCLINSTSILLCIAVTCTHSYSPRARPLMCSWPSGSILPSSHSNWFYWFYALSAVDPLGDVFTHSQDAWYIFPVERKWMCMQYRSWMKIRSTWEKLNMPVYT